MPLDLSYDAPLPYDSTGFYDGSGSGPGGGFFFYPPTVQDEPPYLHPPDSTPVQISLWRHYAPGIRGVNVFKLNDGTFVQDTATPGHPNSSIPYPINVDYPGAPIVSTTNWDGTVINTFIDPYVVKQYFGGTYNLVTAAEADALIAAGYSANILESIPV